MVCRMDGAYPDEIRYFISEPERRRMLYPSAFVALFVLSWLLGGSVWLALGGAIGAFLALASYFAFAGNRVILDRGGIRSRWLFLPERRCGWSEVQDMTIGRVGSRTLCIQVTCRRGLPFRLGAPLRGAGLNDPSFDDKVWSISQYWYSATKSDSSQAPQGNS
jgi:hypothetical protein